MATFEDLMKDMDFMKSVFTTMGELEGDGNIDGAKTAVKSIYASRGVDLSDDNFSTLLDQYKEAKHTVSQLDDNETEMLAAGLYEITRLHSEDPGALRRLGSSFSQVGDMLKGLGD